MEEEEDNEEEEEGCLDFTEEALEVKKREPREESGRRRQRSRSHTRALPLSLLVAEE